MKLTLKLYAGLTQYLPEGSKNHSTEIEISDEETVVSILQKFSVPDESAHLVLVNGVYLDAGKRGQVTLKDGDTLAVWPPVAGG